MLCSHVGLSSQPQHRAAETSGPAPNPKNPKPCPTWRTKKVAAGRLQQGERVEHRGTVHLASPKALEAATAVGCGQMELPRVQEEQKSAWMGELWRATCGGQNAILDPVGLFIVHAVSFNINFGWIVPPNGFKQSFPWGCLTCFASSWELCALLCICVFLSCLLNARNGPACLVSMHPHFLRSCMFWKPAIA